MAFVYKAERNGQDDKGPTDLGPGEYQGPQVYKIKKAFAPFNSTSVRQNKSLKNKLITPGPGSYQIQQDSAQEKVLVSSLNQEIKIIEVPKQNGIFKSGTQRFQHNKEAHKVPGPGHYRVEGNMAIQATGLVNYKQQQNNQESTKQIMQALKGKGTSSQLLIPSVPSKAHAFGYSELENNKLELNTNPFLQEDNKQIGPGQYQIKGTFELNKNKGAAWGKGKSKRKVNQVVNATNQNVGPGSYDYNNDNNIQIHKCKPSSQFLSKSARIFDQQQGKLTQKVINKKLQNQANLMGDEEFQQQEVEYLPNSVPGPGSYNPNNQSSFNLQTKPHNYQIFGMGSQRFPEQKKSLSTHNIGPGTYDDKKHLLQQGKSFNQQSVPFLAMDNRFEKPLLQENPGPGQYNPKINLEDQMIDKLQKGYKGKFGYQEGRFIQNIEEEDMPGPGTYIDPNQYVDRLQKNFDKKTYNFKSQSNRQVFGSNKKSVAPPVGNYQLDYYNLNRKMQKIKEEEAELEIKRPGFYSSQPRFDPLKREEDIEDPDEEQLFEKNFSNGKSTDILYQKKFKKKVPFNTNQQRFSYDEVQKNLDKPGPGTYNDQLNEQWNKRTYNILFADI